MKNKFPWGKVLERFSYDFDGEFCEVVKYHPWTVEGSSVIKGRPNYDVILFNSDELGASYPTIYSVVIAMIVHRRLGQNQHALVAGVCRALDI